MADNADDDDDEKNQLFLVTNEAGFVQALMSLTNDLYSINITDRVPEWQFKDLLEKRIAGRDDSGRMRVSMAIMQTVASDAFFTFVGLLLNEMTNEGKLECAYDDTVNDFVFSVPPNKKVQNEND